MINSILNGLITFIFNLIGIFLAPIDSFISSHLPVVSSALGYIDTLLTYILSFIGYCIDASGLHPVAIGLIVVYLTFAITSTFAMFIVKLLIKWWHMLAP